jgi:hypothetical protein
MVSVDAITTIDVDKVNRTALTVVPGRFLYWGNMASVAAKGIDNSPLLLETDLENLDSFNRLGT